MKNKLKVVYGIRVIRPGGMVALEIWMDPDINEAVLTSFNPNSTVFRKSNCNLETFIKEVEKIRTTP